MTEQSPVTTLPASVAPRWHEDLRAFVGVVVVSVLLGAPTGLLWSAVAPRFTVTRTGTDISAPNIESTKAFIGADGSYFVVVLVVGLLSGVAAWLLARRSGPWTVAGLLVGGVLAALIAQSVGLRPGAPEAIAAISDTSKVQGSIDLFLGMRGASGDLSLRAEWAAVAWPLGAMLSFLVLAFRRPDELD